MIDNHHLDRPLARCELQPKLLLHSNEYRGSRCIGWGIDAAGRPFQREIELTVEPGLIDDRAATMLPIMPRKISLTIIPRPPIAMVVWLPLRILRGPHGTGLGSPASEMQLPSFVGCILSPLPVTVRWNLSSSRVRTRYG